MSHQICHVKFVFLVGVNVGFIFHFLHFFKLPQKLYKTTPFTDAGSGSNLGRTTKTGPLIGCAQPGITGITVDKSVEFTYDELAKATGDFSLANKIGQGGFGAVYYAELRGEVLFIDAHTS